MKRRQPLRIASRISSTSATLLEPGIDPLIAAEDEEIARLERLLGLTNKVGKSAAQTRLNKEFAEEGIGSDFGTFLLELDGLSDRVNRSLPESTQSSPITLSSSDDNDKGYDNEMGSDAVEARLSKKSKQADLYGTKDPEKAYVPPAKRQNTKANESEQLLLRKVTGQINKLSESNKDSILREMTSIYGDNSHQLTNRMLLDVILLNMKGTVHRATNLAILYAAFISGLTVTVGSSVRNYFVEEIFEAFKSCLTTAALSGDLETKMSQNLVIILAGMYNFRQLHHRLIADLLLSLSTAQSVDLFDGIDIAGNISTVLELKMDIVEVILSHSSELLRVDDPTSFDLSLREFSSWSEKLKVDDSSRFRHQYLVEKFTRLRTGNMKNDGLHDVCKQYRKWLGGLKTSFPNRKAETILNVSMADLLQIETNGRWWTVGATWNRATSSKPVEPTLLNVSQSAVDKVDEAATRMQLGGGNKKVIFRILMSCRDVADAYESLQRLGLKGKSDRDIARVLCECVCREHPYNPFYAELSKMLCESSRQLKITFQYVVWDILKSFRSSDSDVTKQAINLAKFVVVLVLNFQLPLMVLKLFQPSDLCGSDISFLTSFFIALFSSSADSSVIENISDRIATSKDFGAVRDLITLFLKVHFKIDGVVDNETKQHIRKNSKAMVKIMTDMRVLDYHDSTPTF